MAFLTVYLLESRRADMYSIDDEERKLLIDAKREAARSFDKTMTTLSAGALAISLTVVKEVAMKPASWRGVLSVAWALFGSALVSILVSFIFSQYAIDARISSNKKDERRWDKGARTANWTSLGFFTLGVMCLLVFALKNFLR
jgi:hypothetical protein